MGHDSNQNYSRWSQDDLRKAEATASQFLEENAQQIAQTLRAKLTFLEHMIERLGQKDASLDQRLDCFARVSEIAQLLEEDANGFFDLASQPMVARLLLRR